MNNFRLNLIFKQTQPQFELALHADPNSISTCLLWIFCSFVDFIMIFTRAMPLYLSFPLKTIEIVHCNIKMQQIPFIYSVRRCGKQYWNGFALWPAHLLPRRCFIFVFVFCYVCLCRQVNGREREREMGCIAHRQKSGMMKMYYCLMNTLFSWLHHTQIHMSRYNMQLLNAYNCKSNISAHKFNLSTFRYKHIFHLKFQF